MTAISSLSLSANRFGFDLTTSSGDKISLSMYDQRSVAYSAVQKEGQTAFSMSLRHEYGYRFHYEGNGIDAKDQKEIEEAMKMIRPLYHRFLEQVQQSQNPLDDKEMTNTAQTIRSLLPQPTTEDGNNYLKDRTVGTMDDVLGLFELSQKLLESTKKLFDKLFDEIHQFDFYG